MGIVGVFFFGFFFLGLICLYVQTKNTWDWRKISKRVLLLSTALAASATVFFFAVDYYIDYEDTHTVATELAGMKLGQSYSSLVFENGGAYTTPDIDDEGDNDDADNEPFWMNRETSKVATIENDTAIDIGVFCGRNNYSLKGIYCGDDSAKIIRKFGNDVEVYCEKNEYVYITKQKSSDGSTEAVETAAHEKSDEDSNEKIPTEAKNDPVFELDSNTERDYVQEKYLNGERTVDSFKGRFYINKKLGVVYYLYENKVSSIRVIRSGTTFLIQKRYMLCSHI